MTSPELVENESTKPNDPVNLAVFELYERMMPQTLPLAAQTTDEATLAKGLDLMKESRRQSQFKRALNRPLR